MAKVDMIVRGEKKLIWVPLTTFNKNRKKPLTLQDFDKFNRIKAGRAYLATEKEERKVTGSYYTPDFIVDYMIENTLGKVVTTKWKEAINNNKSVYEVILSLKILDPAMGSGHFLIGAMEYLASVLIKAVEVDFQRKLMTKSDYSINQAMRDIVSHCIYGVDLNELAVELAKLSFWLRTLNKEEPLSFLNHRLKHGNSLVGTKLKNLHIFPYKSSKGKKQLLQKPILPPKDYVEKLIKKMKEIELIEDTSLQNIKKKENLFNELKRSFEYDLMKVLMDLKTSIYFGNKISDVDYTGLVGVAYNWTENTWKQKKKKNSIDNAIKAAEKRHFFHWELEFPEIFFKENPGFNIIIGNPPYIEFKASTEEKFKNFLKRVSFTTYGRYDIYVPFVERMVKMLNSNGKFSFIMPTAFTKRDYGSKLRKFLTEGYKFEKIVDFADLQLFKEATNYVGIYILNSEKPKDVYEFDSILFPEGMNWDIFQIQRNLNELINIEKFKTSSKSLGEDPWIFSPSKFKNILYKCNENPETKILDDITEEIFEGVASGKDDVFYFTEKDIDRLKLERNLLFPIIMGKEIKRWQFVDETKYFFLYPYDLGTTDLVDIKTYSNIHKYLQSRKQDLSGRDYFDKTGKKWYELWRPREAHLFTNHKIICPYISNQNNFAIAPRNYFFNTTVYGIVSHEYDIYYLLAVLNSKLLEFLLKLISVKQRGGYFRYATDFLKNLPIHIKPKNFKSKLRFLTRMCLLNKFKADNEINNFLKWIEYEWGMEIAKLDNHTKIEEYWKYDSKEILDIAKQNNKKIKINPSIPSFQSLFRIEFKKSITSIKSYLKKIHEHEIKIDAIIFKLYKLTICEMRTVLDYLSIPKDDKLHILREFQKL